MQAYMNIKQTPMHIQRETYMYTNTYTNIQTHTHTQPNQRLPHINLYLSQPTLSGLQLHTPPYPQSLVPRAPAYSGIVGCGEREQQYCTVLLVLQLDVCALLNRQERREGEEEEVGRVEGEELKGREEETVGEGLRRRRTGRKRGKSVLL